MEPDDHDAFDARVLARAVWQKRRMIGTVMLAVAALVFVLASVWPPTYTGEAKIVLDPRKAQIVTNNEVVGNIDPSEQVLNGEIAALRSNLLLREVRNRLPASVIAEIDPVKTGAPVWAAPVTVPAALIDAVAGTAWKPALDDMLRPRPESDEMAETLLIEEIGKKLTILAEPSSYVIVIRADVGNAVAAQILANTVADTYISTQISSRQESVELATRWLEERLETLKLEVERAETVVSEFVAQSLVENGGTMENASEQLSRLNSELIDARDARLTVEARLSELTELTRNEGLLAAVPVIETPSLSVLRARALELRSRDAVWARNFSPDQARRVEIREELSEVDAAMEAEVQNALVGFRNEYEVSLQREDSLRQSISEIEERVVRISRSELGLRQYQREAEAARLNYEALLTRLTEARTQQQMQLPDAKLIARAVTPEKPSAPRPKLMAVFAAVMAGTVTVAMIFFNELTPTVFRSARELSQATGLPVISSLPLLNDDEASDILTLLADDPYGPYAERIRQLRTNVTMGDKRSRSVMLISALQNEGKSSTALALARMAHLAGKSTIILDCDLRRPGLYRTLDLPADLDFADFIQDNCTLHDAICTDTKYGFDVLSVREPYHLGADQFAVSWLNPLIRELKRVYDFVVVDSPAMLSVADAVTVAQVVDRRVFVVAFDETPRTAVRDALSRLQEAQLKIDGIVFSKVDGTRSSEENFEAYGYEL
ncbi:MAG: Wzz/FepE/Etk N-terminal domain-containing protein [Rhodobacteraceae bacterium]|nr:Wzz/FepE/Etk N-terminal domain-containing protein [Paracoccaceae bacterium]